MNGRCDKDPFNRAIDVCDNCYLDVCEDCTVMLKGRSEPICRRCARDLTTPGGGNRNRRKGNRKTVKDRRSLYRERNGEPSDRLFTYFDETEPTEASEEATDETSRRRSWLRRVVHGLEANPTTPGASSSSKERKRQTAVDQLDGLRGDSDADDDHRDPPDIEPLDPLDAVDNAVLAGDTDRMSSNDDDHDSDDHHDDGDNDEDEELHLSQRLRPFLEAKRS